MTRKPSLILTIRSLGPTLRITVLSTVMGVQHRRKVDTIRRDILKTLFWRSRLSLWRLTALRKAMITETEVRMPSVGLRLPLLCDPSVASCCVVMAVIDGCFFLRAFFFCEVWKRVPIRMLSACRIFE
uniref:Uncharacterized protein n=1 Tax=Scophthalmus maximus TaxID=52904 RepID=A0A8D3ACT0_SCOMX